MVIKKHSIQLMALVASLTFGVNSEARTVAALEITGVGMTNETDELTTEFCREFKPTPKQVREYFNHAYHVEGYMLTTERYSPCIAIGTLTYSDGSFGKWTLRSSGVSSFTFNRGNQVYLFSRRYRWHDPMACTYGLGDEGEC